MIISLHATNFIVKNSNIYIYYVYLCVYTFAYICIYTFICYAICSVLGGDTCYIKQKQKEGEVETKS